MIENNDEETISPASVPKSLWTYTSERTSSNTEVDWINNIIIFKESTTFRFERLSEEFSSGFHKITFKLDFSGSQHKNICLGVSNNEQLIKNNGYFDLQNSIIYQSYYPRIFSMGKDISKTTFKAKDEDLITIIFDIDNSTIQFIQNDVDFEEIKVDLPEKICWYYFVVGLFNGKVQIL